MSITIKNLGDIVIYLGALAAALAAIGVVGRYTVLQPLKRWMREQIQPTIRETRDTASETLDAANAVQAEVSPDHGRSIKDTVDRIDRRVDTLGQRFDDHLLTHHGGLQ